MILEITLIILLLFISYMLVLSMRRINQYEDLILQIQQIITFATDKMKQVDSTGHFESDDEVGFFFEELKSIQLSLDGVFEQTEESKNAKG
jgi:hypothetical protein|tara:strand:+ start:166 stop:438 length:273 start_codon:yes stop_codon:yes gene_type:complete